MINYERRFRIMITERKIIYLDADGTEATWIGTAKGLLDDTPNARILTIHDLEYD